LAALIGWVLTGAKVQPIVLAIEDLHWADPQGCSTVYIESLMQHVLTI
jgi:hypothetical protein